MNFEQCFSLTSTLRRARTASGRVVLLLDEVDKYFPDRRDEHNVGVLRAYVTLFRMLRRPCPGASVPISDGSCL